MTSIEIPYEKDRSRSYRFFEILPGALSWSILALPFVLSLFSAALAAIFVLVFILLFFTRAMAVTVRALVGYRTMRAHEKLDWPQLVLEVQSQEVPVGVNRPKWHFSNLARLKERGVVVRPDEVIHAVIIATYNESREVLEPTIQSLIESSYSKKKMIVLLAYEERGGDRVEAQAKDLISTYAKHFMYAEAVKHPRDIPGEVVGKGGNITFAGRYLKEYVESQGIDPLRVAVTTLDSDNRPSALYFAALTYLYCVAPDPAKASYQPIPLFTSNIWDAPAPMRVIATGNSYFYLVLTQRPHLQRNFSAHAQSLRALIDMDFWSVRTIVEDGHQFWRSYFHFDGDYRVYPIALPVYCDAVLAETYMKTLKAQFIQLRRWTYGASDVAYIVDKGFYRKNKIRRSDLIPKVLRHLEGHVHWAVGAILLASAAFIPALLNPESYVANILPVTVSRIQTVGLIGVFASLFVCLKTLPPRPLRYRRHRTIFIVLQWLYLPVTNIVYASFAALYSQTRLMFGKYLTKFDVTVKAVKK
ncbi:MAG: hypothetical protein ACREGD_01585 [Candidatus Saccharimonadales bacterium]